jgi:hypothetical protein
MRTIGLDVHKRFAEVVKGHQHSPSVAMRIPHRQPGVGRFGFSPPLGMDEGVVQVL